MTVKSPIFEPFLDWSEDATDVPITDSLRIQILPTIDELFHARRHQYAAFIASEGMLVVWDVDVTKLFNRAKSIEEKLLEFVSSGKAEIGEKEDYSISVTEIDEELGLAPTSAERPVLVIDAFYVGCSLCILLLLQGLGYAQIAEEVYILGTWTSLALLVMTPINFFLSLVSDLHHQPKSNAEHVLSFWETFWSSPLPSLLDQYSRLGRIRDTTPPYHPSAPSQTISRTSPFKCRSTKRVWSLLSSLP